MRCLVALLLAACLAQGTSLASCMGFCLGQGFDVDFPEVPVEGRTLDVDAPLVLSVRLRCATLPVAVADADAVVAASRVVILPACENGWLGDLPWPQEGAWAERIVMELPLEPRRAHVDPESWGEAVVSLARLADLPLGDYHVVALLDARRAVPDIPVDWLRCNRACVGRGLHVRIDDTGLHALERHASSTPGHATRTGDSSTRLPLDVAQRPTMVLEGRVVTTSGIPIAGAGITASIPIVDGDPTLSIDAVSDGEGSFTLSFPEVPLARVEVDCRADGFLRMGWSRPSAGRLALTLVAEGRAVVRVAAADTDAAVAEVRYELLRSTHDGRGGAPQSVIFGTSSTVDGRLEVDSLAPGTYALVIGAEGLGKVETAAFAVAEGATVELPDIRLPREPADGTRDD